MSVRVQWVRMKFPAVLPEATQETGLLVIYLPTASLQMTSIQAQLQEKLKITHVSCPFNSLSGCQMKF